MTAIAGIEQGGKKGLITEMLDAMSHRGGAWTEVTNNENYTLGLTGTESQSQLGEMFKSDGIARDGNLPGRFAQASFEVKGFSLKRDPLGVAPLYYGWTKDGFLCFASEVKGLLRATTDVHELPPGSVLEGNSIKSFYRVSLQQPLVESEKEIIPKLRELITESVDSCIGDGNVGAWLSGGLDSCVISALASQRVEKMHTFVGGIPGAPDVEYSREMADHLNTRHHEVIVDPQEVMKILPDMVYNLESFDALLVRSSIMNYLVGRETAQYVPAVFSGEGGDELFAGYEYLKELDQEQLPAELIDIANRLHNTALQRVDRSASGHGVLPYVCFLDPRVVNYATRIPVQYKLNEGIEKRILRKAFSDLIPPHVLNRKKAKFWEGAGIKEILHNHAEEQVSNHDFREERNLPNGWVLNSKEELMYYRIFKQSFDDIKDLSWMGRTKGAPVASAV